MAQPQNNHRCKVLSVVWYKILPPKFGGQKAVANFYRYLSELVPLVCLCSRNNEAGATNYPVRANLPVSKSQFVNPFAWWKIMATARKERCTHLLLEFPYHGIAGVLCKKLLGMKLIVNTHNIEFLRFREQARWWWKALYHLEKWTLRNADAVFFKTAADLQMAKGYFHLKENRLMVVPYGTEAKTPAKQEAQVLIRERFGIDADERILLFAGTLDYKPNAVAVKAIAEKLVPLLKKHSFRFKIILCGRNQYPEFQHLNNLQSEHLLFAGEVENVDQYFQAADLFINPVLQGGGVQTKTIDALSFHKSVVGFASKSTGIEQAGNKLITVPDGDWEAFAAAVMAAVENNEITPPSFFETYNWRSIAARASQKIATL